MFLRLSSIWIAAVVATGATASEHERAVIPPPEDCLARPNGNQQQRQTYPQTTESLTEKLDPCNGVLEPPPVGDQELTLYPPDIGEMRIIEPDELPPQQSPQQPNSDRR
jgi:hypothetical protein